MARTLVAMPAGEVAMVFMAAVMPWLPRILQSVGSVGIAQD